MNRVRDEAKKILSLIDLTSLGEGDTVESIQKLCQEARTPLGIPAAVCVYPRFVPYARKYLLEGGIPNVKIATVVNFPWGGEDPELAFSETRAALAYGADEVDLVLPYRAFLAGNEKIPRRMVCGCKAICGARVLLKVILETGELQSPERIRKAALLSLEEGADFIKTSTGKARVNATPEAAQVMLEAIRDFERENTGFRSPGFKAAGGVKTLEDAKVYLDLAESILGKEWISPDYFRFGASSLLKSLLSSIGVSMGD